ncbi:MAG: PD40 domain-containing protein, partial [Planctomycetota bacterium]
STIDEYTRVNRPPNIYPDYSGTLIPPNIAPLNFIVKEKASRYYVKISSTNGNSINVFNKTGRILIPSGPWKKLLSANRGQKFYFDIYTKDKTNQWTRFETITSEIASEDIDDYLVYRKIHPVHNGWRRMGIYQRNLGNFDESLVLDNRFHEGVCLNCHTFYKNQTDKMLIDIRSEKYGSSAILIEDKKASKIGTKFTYISWHPSGRLAAYSVNKVHQFFHTARNEVRGVVDMDSLLAYYLVDSKAVKTSPALSKKNRLETYPAWSPDGRYLYFCSAPMLWSDRNKIPPEQYDKVRYDLLRISYDVEKDRWGDLETVLSAQDTGLSILQPRISPDGRWLLFCMSNYGSFLVYHQSSDLYLMDLKTAQQTGQYKYHWLDINSDQSESWHSWSSNSRWIAFSSKRQYGLFTRIYLSYVDKTGKVHKPILLPQKDPTFYDSCLYTFSVPELVVEPVKVTKDKLGRVVRSARKISVDMPITMATPRVGAPPEPWQERE